MVVVLEVSDVIVFFLNNLFESDFRHSPTSKRKVVQIVDTCGRVCRKVEVPVQRDNPAELRGPLLYEHARAVISLLVANVQNVLKRVLSTVNMQCLQGFEYLYIFNIGTGRNVDYCRVVNCKMGTVGIVKRMVENAIARLVNGQKVLPALEIEKERAVEINN